MNKEVASLRKQIEESANEIKSLTKDIESVNQSKGNTAEAEKRLKAQLEDVRSRLQVNKMHIKNRKGKPRR